VGSRSVPAFSRSNDVSRDDVLQMVFSLRIDEAVAQLRRAYPVSTPALSDYAVDEPADYPDMEGNGYAALRQQLIDPLEVAYGLCLRISGAIANHFGAHG
jgi:phosphoenolpyruvate carboxylase